MNDKICKNCKRHFIEEIAFDYPQSCCHISEGHGKTTEPFLTCDEFEYNSEYLEKKVNQLQSNWNSLRDWLEKQKEDSKTCKEWNNKKGFNDIDYERDIKRFDFVLDKMNELEGNDNNEIK